MYEVEEFYSSNGQDLKELLKTCIFNYYIKNKINNPVNNGLQEKDVTIDEEILSKKGVKYVQTVQ